MTSRTQVREACDSGGFSIAMVGLRGIPATHGGIEQAVEQLSVRMVRQGHHVTVYARNAYAASAARGTYEGVDIIHLPQINTKHLEAISHTFIALLHVLVTRKYDVVHIHATGPSMLSFIPRVARIPTVATIHGLDWQRARWGRFARVVLRFAAWTAVTVPDRTTVVSRDLQRTIESSYGKTATYISNGVVEPAGAGIPVQGLQANKFVLFLGRLVPEKGVDTLIRAYRHVEGDQPLVIAGPDQGDASYARALRVLAAEDGRVRLIGPAYGEQKDWLLQNASAFVQVSSLEGLPIALLEAIAAGTYPIVSNIAPHLEVLAVDSGQVGHTVPVSDVPALSAAIRDVIANPERCATAMTHLRHAVAERYSWSDATTKTLGEYEAAVSQRKLSRVRAPNWLRRNRASRPR